MLLDRRACLRLAASVLPFARPNSSPAAGTIAYTSPELQYLEPIYELKFSLDALRAAVENPTPERITALRGRLKKFFGGPLSDEWIEGRRQLALQVLGRMRALGMTPALGGFSGHVPKAFVDRYPNASVSRSPDWGNFKKDDPKTAAFADVYLLEPTDPLFAQVGAAFIKVQAAEYGTDHIYQADTYNEMIPPTADPSYLKRSAAAVYGAMAAADPDAVWLMQGWLFFSAPGFWNGRGSGESGPYGSYGSGPVKPPGRGG